MDIESDVDEVELVSNVEEMQRRLEVLLGAKPEAPVDMSLQQKAEAERQQLARQQQVAAAGGEMLGAAFNFLGELIKDQAVAEPSEEAVNSIRDRLSESVEIDDDGRPRLAITLPNDKALNDLANTLARLLAAASPDPRG